VYTFNLFDYSDLMFLTLRFSWHYHLANQGNNTNKNNALSKINVYFQQVRYMHCT
jgi:hypothetical protein